MIKNVLVFLAVFHIAIPNISLACNKSVTLLDKGTPAPCTGFLFSPKAEQKAASDAEDSKYYKLLSEKLADRQKLQTEQMTIMDQRLQLYMDQSNELSKELTRREDNRFWKDVLYFSLGVVVTGIAVSAAKDL